MSTSFDFTGLPWMRYQDINVFSNEYNPKHADDRCTSRLWENDNALYGFMADFDYPIIWNQASVDDTLSGKLHDPYPETVSAVTPSGLSHWRPEYISVSSHSSYNLSQSRGSTGDDVYTYSLSGFSPSLYDMIVTKIYVSCATNVNAGANTGFAFVKAYVDGNFFMLLTADTRIADGAIILNNNHMGNIIPISRNTTEFNITLYVNDARMEAASFRIDGVEAYRKVRVS